MKNPIDVMGIDIFFSERWKIFLKTLQAFRTAKRKVFHSLDGRTWIAISDLILRRELFKS
jgi:hypothetical protein